MGQFPFGNDADDEKDVEKEGEGVSRLDLRWEYWIWNGAGHASLQCTVMRSAMMKVMICFCVFEMKFLGLKSLFQQS